MVPPLDGADGNSAHLDRCWLDDEKKRTVRILADGEIGLEEPAT
jgi:hypothetical protein